MAAEFKKVKLKKKPAPPADAGNDTGKAGKQTTGKPAPAALKAVEAVPVKTPLPSAAELWATWYPGWTKARQHGSRWIGPKHPLRARLSDKGHRPLAAVQDYRGDTESREQFHSLEWAIHAVEEWTIAAGRLLDAALVESRRVFCRASTDARGRLTGGPKGCLIDFARWQRRTEAMAELAAGRWDPDSSLSPPGEAPAPFDNPAEAVGGVFAALATCRELAARVAIYPNLECNPYPLEFRARMDQIDADARADLVLMQGILSSLGDCREWKPLLELDPAAAQPSQARANRIFWDCSSRARDESLRSTGWTVHEVRGLKASGQPLGDDQSLGMGPKDPRGTWVRDGKCWWEPATSLERDHHWRRDCLRREQLREQLEACVDDADAPTEIRKQTLDRKLFIERQLKVLEKQIESLAGDMLAVPEKERNGTSD